MSISKLLRIMEVNCDKIVLPHKTILVLQFGLVPTISKVI
jgi:hypothetical protein